MYHQILCTNDYNSTHRPAQKPYIMQGINSMKKSTHRDVTVLLVEDDDVDAMAIERSFNKARVANTIMRAANGLEALKMLTNNEISLPYIILLDLNMPRMNGLEFLTELRSNPDISDSIVFVLTTSDKDEDIVSSYKMNVAGYFLKNEAGAGFSNVIAMLEGYWKIAVLPS